MSQLGGRHERAGFTILEMAVVLAVLAVIASFAVPAVVRAHQNSRIKTVLAQARQIQVAFEQYYHDHAGYPPATAIGGTAEQMYTAAFGAGGALTEYVSLSTSAAKAPFAPAGYAEITGAQPRYELVVLTKDVESGRGAVYITPSGATTRAPSPGAWAEPSGTLDIENDSPNADAQLGTTVTVNTNYAQTFVPATTGSLGWVSLRMIRYHDNIANLVVEIRTTDGAGTPTDTVLGMGTIPASAVVSGDYLAANWVNASISPAPSLAAGTLYAIVLRCPACQIARYFALTHPSGNRYGNGLLWGQDVSTGQWSQTTTNDARFRTYMQ